jgi:hypothetical protein
MAGASSVERHESYMTARNNGAVISQGLQASKTGEGRDTS